MKRLAAQSLQPDRIIIMNTEEKYFEALLFGSQLHQEYPKAEVHHLSKREFDHGGTRNLGVMKSDGDVFICMTPVSYTHLNGRKKRIEDHSGDSQL